MMLNSGVWFKYPDRSSTTKPSSGNSGKISIQVRRFGMVLLAVWWSLTGLSWGQEIVLIDFNQEQHAIPQGWELRVKRGNPELQLVPVAEGQALHLRSDNASFALQKHVRISLQDNPFLVWKWKVTELPSGGDFRQRHTDDQAAQLIVAFSTSRFISYIWDSSVPKGTFGEAPAPPFRKILALVMQSGSQALGSWITERRNVVQDYLRLFGETPEAIRGVRIQINSQHTRSCAEAYWRSIVLTGHQRTS
jgi:hypothetical protein